MVQTSKTAVSQATLHAMAWADYELIDRQLSPLGLKALDSLNPLSGEVIVDVGCGTGQTLLQLADRVGIMGQVFGVEIAPLLIEVAVERTNDFRQIKVIEADAQTVDLPSRAADAVFSRFGVMAFDNPVAAFSNFRRILKPAGRLAFCCWRSLQENQLDHFPLAAAGVQVSDDRPFSFANADYISRTLGAAGFDRVEIRAHDEMVSSGDLDEMTSVLLRVGPLGKVVRESPDLRPTADSLLRRALADQGNPRKIELLASVWIVTAEVSSQWKATAASDQFRGDALQKTRRKS